ncbi:kinase-like protein [Thelephora ganbajun]|uniref:Kinase-like protein n=1 Tax=Thelephora ganbajun TaxID=370292 RepID=A0ACB6Z1M4_THEGA|nr:kinase-like protein [Thelephora ganbajun]
MAKKSNAATTLRDLTHIEIQEFALSNLTPEASRRQTAFLLNNKDLVRDVLKLTPEDQVKFIDKIDQAYSTICSQNARSIAALGDLCSAIERLPTSAVLSLGLEKHGSVPAASGDLTDIWRGYVGGSSVAIRAFRMYPAYLKEAIKILWKRVPMWTRLSHENILPFRGVNMTLFQLALVYDWGQNGNISQYVASHPHASRPSLILDVAKGLEYLHSLNIPHGDLKGANVIIDQRGRARLTEYGLAPINSDPSFTVAATPGTVGAARWQAPEIILPPRRRGSMPVMESKAADVFAFGMFAVEVFTGKIPFEEQKNEAVVLRISQGGRPDMPANAQAVGLTGEMWKLLENCWHQNPKKRPAMGEVVRKWQKFVENINDDNNVAPEERGEGTSRRRVKSEAPQPRTKAEAVRLRTKSEVTQPRTKPGPVRSKSVFEAVQNPRSEVIQRGPKLEVVQPVTPVFGPPPSKSVFRGGHQSQVLMHDVWIPQHLRVEDAFVDCSNLVVSRIDPLSRLYRSFPRIGVYHL